ncbi:type II toxin-antitoxin system PemK/MazF family toxin [Micrococcus sp. EYE_162]|uniref:type II toxin-antitoxin system PemK/MazF family toxin n=1 Tax=unclassified Micrococcus TaxID=2620948 RepID=UPI0032B7AFBE|nr:type II toxin-antitoxin system PemK/MazF family toxin [Micrococcus sp. EYE_212]MCK6170811.1 type II toxin-antitoxin system PemK/MazF family toxin [Micrococcus sp. EYE_162]
MAFDFQRALSLGRQAARLLETLSSSSDAGPRRGSSRRASGSGTGGGAGPVFDLGVPPRDPGAPAFDPTRRTDDWPTPPAGGARRTDRRRVDEVLRRARDADRAEGPAASGRAAGRPDRRSPAELLPDFTGRARVDYAPVPGPAAGPGEVVWTWVPFEEMDGRGKDRPVLLVGRDGACLLGLMLTSRDRNNADLRDEDYVDVGAGPWDRRGRASEAKVDRVLRVDPDAVRREGGVLDPARFEAVGDALRRHQGWEC